jgi:hypothetical protein
MWKASSVMSRKTGLALLAAICVLAACVRTQHVTVVTPQDPDAQACFSACRATGDALTCARACPGVEVMNGDCAAHEQECVSGTEIDGGRTTLLVSLLVGILVSVGFVAAMSTAR